MTLYRKLLEERIDNQQYTGGVIAFWNKVPTNSKSNNTEHSGSIATKPNSSVSNSIQSNSNQSNYIKSNSSQPKSNPPSVKITNESIISCENTPLQPDTLENEVIAKIPVVLAEFVIQLNIDSLIDLHEPVYRLHKSSKQLHITKCLLIQNTNTLFIKGFVRNNFEYYGYELKDCSVDIPFKCTTAVMFNGIMPAAIIPNSVQKFEYGQNLSMTEHKNYDTDDYWQLNQISTAFYNERPFCEIVSSRIVEINEIQNNHLESTIIEGNLVLYITLKILQYRQITVLSSKKKK